MYNNYIFDLYGTLIDINTDEWNDDLWKKNYHSLCLQGCTLHI